MIDMARTQRTERIGVHKLGEFFARVGWLFREQPTEDFGIDAHVEIAEGDKALGALIGIQIKSGLSYFAKTNDKSIIFRSNDKHVEYWVRHRLPVIVALYDVDKDVFYWEAISKDNVRRTGKDWRIDVPKQNILSEESLPKLKALTQPPPYTQRLNRLRLDRKWIDLVASGEVVYVEFDDWVNKSLPRFAVEIGCDTRNDIESQQWPMTYGPGLSFEELLAHLLPWADFRMDETAWENFMENEWMNECYMWHDKETGETFYSMPFSEYFAPPDGIQPISRGGEVDGYRLLVELNDLGRAFITVDDYLVEEDGLENRTFTF
jgi:hypothetical protein